MALLFITREQDSECRELQGPRPATCVALPESDTVRSASLYVCKADKSRERETPTTLLPKQASHVASDKLSKDYSANDRHKIVGPFLLVLSLQDRWQPIREEQLAMRTNDCWLPGETGPRTNGRGPSILCLSFQLFSR